MEYATKKRRRRFWRLVQTSSAGRPGLREAGTGLIKALNSATEMPVQVPSGSAQFEPVSGQTHRLSPMVAANGCRHVTQGNGQ